MLLILIVLYLMAHSVTPVAFAVTVMAVTSAHPILTILLLLIFEG